MIRIVICFILLSVNPLYADEPFSAEADKALKECLASHDEIDGTERYAFLEAEDSAEDNWYKIPEGDDGWSSERGEIFEQLEFNLAGEALVSLRNTSASEQGYSQTDICFFETGEPAVSIQSESYSYDWICDASGKKIASDDYVTLEKLTQLSTSGLFGVEIRVFTHGQEIVQERFCGPMAVLHELHQPGRYLPPTEQISSDTVTDMRKNSPEL